MPFKDQSIKFIYFLIEYVKNLVLETFIIVFIKFYPKYYASAITIAEKESFDIDYKILTIY
jgi:hypothetical protein